MISIIVCTYNRDKYLPKMLESAAKQKSAKEAFELILVNNKSTDSTEKICSEFGENNNHINYRYFLETQQGLSFARNRGVAEAKGKYIVFIDDDAFLDENYVKELTQYLSSTTEQYIGFGGKILPFLECELPKWMSKFLASLMSIIDMGTEITKFQGTKYPIGANMGFSKAVFDEIGGFNTELGRIGKSMLGGEEKDFFFRVKNLNAPIYYFPKMLVHHVIPKERLTEEFVKKAANGIGVSEKLRTKKTGEYFKRSLAEIYKWGGTFGLFGIYLFKGQPSKGVMLVKFRWWISKGLWG
ncbi:MAG: glycosyltransferase [Vicingaceae bacterium]|nr:glycosyltransferase [Vicingaceae bacterium]